MWLKNNKENLSLAGIVYDYYETYSFKQTDQMSTTNNTNDQQSFGLLQLSEFEPF